ncbi:hypothetical protein M5K25_002498 [Dendrobium thyrsiflorum]|uniref:Uncharacterized protein n=1 Tax=Dendrobium thyrsiflorum TaxID=117978 RepID=A0ABD0VND9_DENTH
MAKSSIKGHVPCSYWQEITRSGDNRGEQRDTRDFDRVGRDTRYLSGILAETPRFRGQHCVMDS